MIMYQNPSLSSFLGSSLPQKLLELRQEKAGVLLGFQTGGLHSYGKLSYSKLIIRRKTYCILSHLMKRGQVTHLHNGLSSTEGNSEPTSNNSGGWEVQDGADMSDENQLPGSQTAIFLLCPHRLKEQEVAFLKKIHGSVWNKRQLDKKKTGMIKQLSH